MFSDLITFIQTLPDPSAASGAFLPDSFDLGSIPLQSVGSFLDQLDASVKIGALAVPLILSLLGCFFGYKLSKLFMSLTGLLTGGVLGYTAGAALLHVSGTPRGLCAAAGALILAALAYRIYQAGIFILCFFLAFMAAAALLPFNGDIQFFLSTVTGFLIGSLALRFIRPVIILTSAITCGSSAAGLAAAIARLAGIYTITSMPAFGLTAILCILGAVIQFLTTSEPAAGKRHKKKRHKH